MGDVINVKTQFILCNIVNETGVCGVPYDDNQDAHDEHLQIYHPFIRHTNDCPENVDYYWYALATSDNDDYPVVRGLAVGCECCSTCFLLTTVTPMSIR